MEAPASDATTPAPGLTSWVAGLRAQEPSSLAILLFGSRATVTHGPYSDLDLRIITAGEPRERDRFLIEEHAGRLLHISVGSRSIAELLRLASDPAHWPFLAATYATAQLLWEEAGTLDLLRRCIAANEPPARPYRDRLPIEVETLVEYVAKVKNAAKSGRFDRAAFFSRKAAEQCRLILLACTPVQVAAGELALLDAVPRLGAGIPGWARRMSFCQGLSPESRNMQQLLDEVVALACSVIDWLAARPE